MHARLHLFVREGFILLGAHYLRYRIAQFFPVICQPLHQDACLRARTVGPNMPHPFPAPICT